MNKVELWWTLYFFNSIPQASRQSEVLCLGTTLQLQLSGATEMKSYSLVELTAGGISKRPTAADPSDLLARSLYCAMYGMWLLHLLIKTFYRLGLMCVSPHGFLFNRWNIMLDFICRLLHENNICLQKNRNHSWDGKIFLLIPHFIISQYIWPSRHKYVATYRQFECQDEVLFLCWWQQTPVDLQVKSIHFVVTQNIVFLNQKYILL